VAGQHDQVNVQAFGKVEHLVYNFASQNFSPGYDSFRFAASDNLFQVLRSALL
jgi:hypothetical protein